MGLSLFSCFPVFPCDRKARIEARTQDLEAEYLTLQEVRKTARLTQAGVSQELGVPQSNVSRLEKGSDMLLSTLRQYIEAIGGKLNLTVELPNKPSNQAERIKRSGRPAGYHRKSAVAGNQAVKALSVLRHEIHTEFGRLYCGLTSGRRK